MITADTGLGNRGGNSYALANNCNKGCPPIAVVAKIKAYACWMNVSK